MNCVAFRNVFAGFVIAIPFDADIVIICFSPFTFLEIIERTSHLNTAYFLAWRNHQCDYDYKLMAFSAITIIIPVAIKNELFSLQMQNTCPGKNYLGSKIINMSK